MAEIDPNKVNIQKVTVRDMLQYIYDEGEYDDWRDMFQSIHNWGYNTDFTYSDIPNHANMSVYLAAYIKDVFGDEE